MTNPHVRERSPHISLLRSAGFFFGDGPLKAKLNYASVRKMLDERLFPEPKSAWGSYPRLVEKTGDIVFDGHAPSATDPEKPVTFTRCRITPDGTMTTSKAHLAWLMTQAVEHNLPLDIVIIPPPPPQVKLEKNRKKAGSKEKMVDQQESTVKTALPARTKEPALSLAERLKALKQAKPSPDDHLASAGK